MGVGGSIAAMLSSLRNNSKMLRKKGMFKKESGFLSGKKEFLKATKGRLELRKATPEELKKVREVIKQNRKTERTNLILAGVVSIFIALLIFHFSSTFFTSNNLNPYRIQSRYDRFADPSEKLRNDYFYYLEAGDKYIAEKHWHNAIFQYTKGLEIFPKEFDANYRLALAYSYSCVHAKKRCIEAKYLIEKIAKEFPERQEILALKSNVIVMDKK